MAGETHSHLGETDVDSNRLLTRRGFIRQNTVSLAGSAVVANVGVRFAGAQEGSDKPLVRIGLLTDLHYADKPSAGTRHYRETPAKLAEAAKRFGENAVAKFGRKGEW